MNAFDPKYESQLDNDGDATNSPVALRDARDFFLDRIIGLGRPQKTLSCKWLYDDTGSTLLEATCATPEYYISHSPGKVGSVPLRVAGGASKSGECQNSIAPSEASTTHELR